MQLGLCQAILDGKLNLTEAVKREWKDRRGGKRGQPQRGPWLLLQSAVPDEVILVVVQRFFDAGSRARPNIPPPPGPPAQNQPLDFFSSSSSLSLVSFYSSRPQTTPLHSKWHSESCTVLLYVIPIHPSLLFTSDFPVFNLCLNHTNLLHTIGKRSYHRRSSRC